MSPTTLHQQAKRRLEAREADEATEELLALPSFFDELKSAEEEVEAGLLTPVKELRRRG